MSISSNVSDDSPCGVCQEPVIVGDQALECDLCSTWFHLHCNGASPESYDLFLGCEGLIPWFCNSCKASLRSSISSIKQLRDENEVLRHQLAEIHSEVSNLIDKGLLAPLSQDSPHIISNSLDSQELQASLPSPSPIHQHIVINDTSSNPSVPPIDSVPGSTNNMPDSDSLPLPSPASVTTVNSIPNSSNRGGFRKQKKAALPIDQQEMPETRFIRRIEQSIPVDDVKKSLKDANINIDNCFIEQTLPQVEFQGKYKFVRIILPNQSHADEFANALKSSNSLNWKFSRKQPVQQKKKKIFSLFARELGQGTNTISSSSLNAGGGSQFLNGVVPGVPGLHPPPLPPCHFLGLPPWLPTFLPSMIPPFPPPRFVPTVPPRLPPSPHPSLFRCPPRTQNHV